MVFTSIRKIGIFLLSTFLVTACLFDSGVEWKDGSFEVAWIDNSEDKYLYYIFESGGGPSVIKHPVVAVGNDEFYIVVKTRDLTKWNSYYYIVKSDESKILKGLEIARGPFTVKEFETLTDQLDLPSLSQRID